MEGFNTTNAADKNPLNLNQGSMGNTNGDKMEERKKTILKNNTVNESSSGTVVLLASVLFFLCTIGYTAYVFFERNATLQKISSISEELQRIENSIDKKELQDFINLDKQINYAKSKLSKHLIFSDVFALVNQNIRSSIQISQYDISLEEKNISVSISCIAPTFKDLAEQTEKMFQLKNQGVISSFSVSGLSYEQETKRVRFTLRIKLDQSKFSALGYSESIKPKN